MIGTFEPVSPSPSADLSWPSIVGDSSINSGLKSLRPKNARVPPNSPRSPSLTRPALRSQLLTQVKPDRSTDDASLRSILRTQSVAVRRGQVRFANVDMPDPTTLAWSPRNHSGDLSFTRLSFSPYRLSSSDLAGPSSPSASTAPSTPSKIYDFSSTEYSLSTIYPDTTLSFLDADPSRALGADLDLGDEGGWERCDALQALWEYGTDSSPPSSRGQSILAIAAEDTEGGFPHRPHDLALSKDGLSTASKKEAPTGTFANAAA